MFPPTETTANGDAREVGRLMRVLRTLGPMLAAIVIGTASALAWLDHRIDAHTADEIAPIAVTLADIREHIASIEREQLRHAAQLTRVETIIDLEREQHHARDP